MSTAVIYSTAYLTEPGDIAAVPHDSDKCMIPFDLWNHEIMFVKITTATAKSFVLRVGGWHKCEEPFNRAVFVPYWIMTNLHPIEDGDEAMVQNVKHQIGDEEIVDTESEYDDDELIVDEPPVLQAASQIKLRAHSRMFLDVDDPKAWLEGALQNMSVITCPSTVPLSYMGEEFEFDIMQIEPHNRLRAVHLIDTDVEIDFEAPVDYVEPVREPTPVPIWNPDAQEAPEEVVQPVVEGFVGEGRRLDEAAPPPPVDPAQRRAVMLAAIARRNAAAGEK